jgi:hypothetical protein
MIQQIHTKIHRENSQKEETTMELSIDIRSPDFNNNNLNSSHPKQVSPSQVYLKESSTGLLSHNEVIVDFKLNENLINNLICI